MTVLKATHTDKGTYYFSNYNKAAATLGIPPHNIKMYMHAKGWKFEWIEIDLGIELNPKEI